MLPLKHRSRATPAEESVNAWSRPRRCPCVEEFQSHGIHRLLRENPQSYIFARLYPAVSTGSSVTSHDKTTNVRPLGRLGFVI